MSPMDSQNPVAVYIRLVIKIKITEEAMPRNFKFLSTKPIPQFPNHFMEDELGNTARISQFVADEGSEYDTVGLGTIMRRERNRYMEDLFQQGFIHQEIISQDENGMTIRTEFR